MGTYLIVNATPNLENQEAIQAYTGGVLPMLQNAGGKSLKRAKLASIIKGKANYPMFLFMEFDDASRISELFESEAYQQLIPHRDKAFKELNIYTFTSL